jgi:thiosulfate/3-mercaptopyruvate sulfurtransferase
MSMYTSLISAAQLKALNDAFIVDCSFDLTDASAGQKAYAASHIAGAAYLHLEQHLSAKKLGTPPVNGRHPLNNMRDIEHHLASIGVNAHQQIICYDRNGGMYAARLWWMLRWLGHEAVAVLDGGFAAWQAAGGAVDAATPHYAQGSFKARASLSSHVPKQDVAANLRSKQRIVMDARAPERYRGEVEPLDPVAGHIPGAVNRNFKDNFQADGTFKPLEQLHREFTALLGRYKAHEVIHQCGSGVTACVNLLAMEHAGLHGALLYPGSWSEWCADVSLPIEKHIEK